MQRLKFQRLELSYLEAAPDHGAPELAVILERGRRRKVVPVAVGKRATELWQHPLSEEAFLELAHAEVAQVVSD